MVYFPLQHTFPWNNGALGMDLECHRRVATSRLAGESHKELGPGEAAEEVVFGEIESVETPIFSPKNHRSGAGIYCKGSFFFFLGGGGGTQFPLQWFWNEVWCHGSKKQQMVDGEMLVAAPRYHWVETLLCSPGKVGKMNDEGLKRCIFFFDLTTVVAPKKCWWLQYVICTCIWIVTDIS